MTRKVGNTEPDSIGPGRCTVPDVEPSVVGERGRRSPPSIRGEGARRRGLRHAIRPHRPRTRRKLTLPLLGLLVVSATVVFTPTAAYPVPAVQPDDMWVANGHVDEIEPLGNRIFIGGQFGFVGPSTGHLVQVNPSTGALAQSFRVNGDVYAAIVDGSGGWFIGGAFTAVNGVYRTNLAHVLANGSVDPGWDSPVNGAVFALLRRGARLFVGGAFSHIWWADRANLAALDTANGNPYGAWTTGADAPVQAFAFDDTTGRLFVGGAFTKVGSLTRSRLAAVNASTGKVDVGFAPAADNTVYTMALSGTRLYVAGAFTVLGIPRNRVAAVDYLSGFTDASFNGSANGTVRAMALSANAQTIFLGGDFTKLGNVGRSYAGAVSTTGGVMPWAPWPNRSVLTIALAPDGSSVYLGGSFTSLRDTMAWRVGVVDPVVGRAVRAFAVRADNPVHVIVPGSSPTSPVLLGGQFTSIGTNLQPFLAALDLNTGTLDTSFRPALDNYVYSMAVSQDRTTLYVGGDFTTVNGQPRGRGAAFDIASGALLAWDPKANERIDAIAPAGDLVYVGGNFTQLSGRVVRYLGRTDAATGMAAPLWLPAPDQRVYAIGLSPDYQTIYAGGSFGFIGGQARKKLAAVKAQNGLATPWKPNASQAVLSLAVAGDGWSIIAGVGGNGNGGNSVRKYNIFDGTQVWEKDFDGDQQAVELSPDGATVYTGGHGEHVLSPEQATRNEIAAIDMLTGALLPWDPGFNTPDHGVWAIAATPDGLLVGGDFTAVGTTPVRGIVRFSGTP